MAHYPPKQDGFQLCLQEHDNFIDTAVMTSTIAINYEIPHESLRGSAREYYVSLVIRRAYF